MADGAKIVPYRELEAELARTKEELENGPKKSPDRKSVRETAAQLYGRGFKRSQIARTLVDYLVPNGKDRPLEQRLSQARKKLRNWERNQEVRDQVYNGAVVALDMSTPGILRGVGKKARRGRVDAARLALEVTGRHNPKGDVAPTQVAVIFTGIPRPDGPAPVVVEGKAEEDDEA